MTGRAPNVAFLHPDLGLGGAERLVVDAALELQARGSRVTIFTARRDRLRCFDEARDGTLDVRVYGDFFPMNLAGRLRAPCTIARTAYAAAALRLARGSYDVVFCDLVAHVLPLLRWFGGAPVVFYCHFPDQLLATRRGSWFRAYRAPIDWLEERGITMAARVFVNSRFTASEFRAAFPRLPMVLPEVLFPGVDLGKYAEPSPPAEGAGRTILSVNRYERRKNVTLAVDAFARLRSRVPEAAFATLRLVIAGGYSEGSRENRETLQVLQQSARSLGVSDQVEFLLSPSEDERLALLSACCCVVYTAEREHFGYVPVEAMAAGRPVVAVASGGPMETVVDGETGFLCPADADAFSEALGGLLNDRALAQRLGRAGRQRVAACFSRQVFGARLDRIVREVADSSC